MFKLLEVCPSVPEVSSFQGVRIVGLYCMEVFSFQGIGFHCIQMTCPQFRGGGGSTVYRGVLNSGGWNRGLPLYTEVSSIQGVGIEGFHCIQRCPHFRVLE